MSSCTLPRRDVTARIEADGYPPNLRKFDLSSEFKRQVIRLRRSVEVRFEVRRENRRWAGRSTVKVLGLSAPAEGAKPLDLSERTNRGGLLRLQLPPGRYRVEARVERTGWSDSKEIVIRGEPSQRVVLTVRGR